MPLPLPSCSRLSLGVNRPLHGEEQNKFSKKLVEIVEIPVEIEQRIFCDLCVILRVKWV